ncbi:MAG: L,D-transpeptidase family protein [Phycisphaeraceae bacterium]
MAPWLALLGVAVIVVGLIVIFGGGDDPAKTANAATPGDSDAKQHQGEGTPSTAGQSVGQSASIGNTDPPTRPRSGERTTANGNADNDTPSRAGNPPERYAGPEAIATLNEPKHAFRGENKDQYELGMQRLEAGDLVNGRKLLSELLFRDGALPRAEAHEVRDLLTELNRQHVFSKSRRSAEQIDRDPIVALHKVQSGEYLGTIANTYRTPYQFIERVNNIEARRLQAGQTIQVLKGPVHARVDKSDYRMDLYVVDDAGLPIFLKSFDVGLGEFDSTPVGEYRIKPGSKVGPDAANGKGPSWRNPRTGKVYDSDDPDIPIGEYWMALEGTEERTKGVVGYGIHATNDPNSIGQQQSMGCIRMRDEDVDEVFYTLFEGASTVQIVP